MKPIIVIGASQIVRFFFVVLLAIVVACLVVGFFVGAFS